MLANFVLRILELNWNQRGRDKKTNLKICLQVLTSSTQRQNWSFHVVERTRTTTIFKWKMYVQSLQTTVFHSCFKYANLLGSCYVRRPACLSSLKSDSWHIMYTSQSVSLAQSINWSLTKQSQTKFLGLMGHYITPCEDSVKQLEQHFANVLDTWGISWRSWVFSCSSRKLFQVNLVNDVTCLTQLKGLHFLRKWPTV